jgi:hypothetical protein
MDGVRLSKLEPQQSEDSSPMPGFRFHPTDEELVAYYLPRQLRRKRLPVAVITQLDIYKYDPWDLPSMYFAVLDSIQNLVATVRQI